MNNFTKKDLKILYVEDDTIIRVEFAEILNRMFNSVKTAPNGKIALDIYNDLLENEDAIDLIISDVNMPIMDGLHLLEEVRKIDKKIPFIFTTAQTDISYLQKAISLNISEYLIKPIKIKELQTKTTEIFDNLFLEKSYHYREQKLTKYTEVIDDVAIISKTDKHGIITYANDSFYEISGYEKNELIGTNHNIIRHPNMKEEVFETLWTNIKQGKVWRGNIQNRAKNGDSYYTSATIIPVFDETNIEIVEYIGIRFLISQV